MQNDNCFSINPTEHTDKATSKYMKLQLFYGLQHVFSEELNESQMLHILGASSGTLVLVFGVRLT